MGNLRVETIAKLLASPVDTERILDDYASRKTLKIGVKHGCDSGPDLYEKCGPHTEKLIKQAAVARRFMSQDLKERILDQSPKGAARTSEEMGFILKCCNALKAASKAVELVKAYSGLLSLLANSSEPLVRSAVKKVLRQIAQDTPAAQCRALFSRPLAVAIGLRFDGLPEDEGHRRNVSKFLKTHLSDELEEVAHAVRVELAGAQIAETMKLLLKSVSLYRT